MNSENDWYCNFYIKMFSEIGIKFNTINIIDNRVDSISALKIINDSDVIWLSGGDTPQQYKYFKEYNLVDVIKNYKGIIIGLSAGAINMTKTALCTLTCDHDKFVIYNAIGLVDFSIEPHFINNKITDELIELSFKNPFFGICDDSGIIIDSKNNIKYIGEIYKVEKGQVSKIKN